MTTTGHARPGAPPAARARQAFHLLAKPTDATCNLGCAYCFFLSKQALYLGSEFRMTDDLLELYLRELLAAHVGIPEVVVAWQGGEPALMGLGFFRRSVEMAESLRQPYQRVTHTIQTNGTLLNDQWAEFLARHDFLVGISIDGPRDMHDAYRADKAGRGSFSRVMRGLDVLRRRGVAWNALCAVRAANQNRGRVFVQMFDVALANWFGERPDLCIHSETCGLALAREHNGDLYSCDHFVEPATTARAMPGAAGTNRARAGRAASGSDAAAGFTPAGFTPAG